MKDDNLGTIRLRLRLQKKYKNTVLRFSTYYSYYEEHERVVARINPTIMNNYISFTNDYAGLNYQHFKDASFGSFILA